MTSQNTPPSTIGGIKRLATAIKREQRIPHHRALDLAAQRAGYHNIRDAQNRLPALEAIATGEGNAIFLTAYWRTSSRPYSWGRETLRVVLPKSLAEIGKPTELRAERSISWFKLEAPDHLERRLDCQSVEDARERLLACARALRFMAATGLRPATTRKQRAGFDRARIPGLDHQTIWTDPATGETVSLDEPYARPDEVIQERASLLANEGLVMVAPAWGGLWNPGYAHPFFVLRDAALARLLQTKVETMQALSELVWESGNYGERFVSPARASTGRAPSRRPMPAFRGSIRAGAVAYGGQPGTGARWRPATPMPLAQHQALGEHFKTLSCSALPARVRDVVIATRSTLEDWAFAEHGDEAENDLYYGGRSEALGDEGRGRAMTEIIRLIRTGYQECAPKRQMLARLERAAAAL